MTTHPDRVSPSSETALNVLSFIFLGLLIVGLGFGVAYMNGFLTGRITPGDQDHASIEDIPAISRSAEASN